MKKLLLCMVVAGSSAFAADTTPVSVPTVNERLTLARASIQAKEWSKALGELNAAARAEPRNADVHNLLGYSYRKQATPNLGKAFEHYNTALKLDPKHRGANEYIGEAYLMVKKPDKAREHLAALKSICGTECEEYRNLDKAIAAYKP